MTPAQMKKLDGELEKFLDHITEGDGPPRTTPSDGQATDGTAARRSAEDAFARVRMGDKHTKGRTPSEELWLIVEWRPGNDERK